MKLIRLFATGSLGLLASALAGCLAEPSYSAVPEISFNKATVTLTDSNTNAHMELTINYQDGDGDLGLTEPEYTKAPYANTRFAKNFFANPFVRNLSGQYVQLADAGRNTNIIIYKTDSYDQTFVHASAAADNRSIPIKGTLTYSYDFSRYNPFPIAGETVEFHISIADRAMHESNVIIVPVTFPR